jgi:NADH-quinone oxidoreductase subunit N
MATDFIYGLLPEHLLLGLLFVLMMLEIVDKGTRLAPGLVTLVLGAACAAVLWQYSRGYTSELLPGEIHIDRFALLAKLVILGCGTLWSLLFAAHTSCKSGFLVCSSLLGALIVMDSASFVPLFLGIEMMSLPAFALMVHAAGAGAAAEGAFKYLLLSSVASALLLLGIAFGYDATGTLSTDAFARLVGTGSAQGVTAGILLASGFFIKAALFPFHGWAPDAYGAVRLRVAGLLASVVKGAVILALVRILADVVLNSATAAIVASLSVLSILFGNIVAIRQRSFKRLLAYSSIAHAGYMLLAFVDTTGGRAADLLWYVGIYAVTVIVACAAFSYLCPDEQDDVRALDGAFRSHPAAALLFGLAMLSLAGLPPLPGFFAKLFVFKSVIASEYLATAVIAFVGSFVGVTYYLALFFRLFATERALADLQSEGR